MVARLETVALGLLTVVFAAVASLALVTPTGFFEAVGVSLDTVAGRAEIRAAYGGLFGAMTWYFGRAVVHDTRRLEALSMASLILGGFTFGRVWSWVVDGAPQRDLAIANLIVEAVGFAVALLLYRARRSRTASVLS